MADLYGLDASGLPPEYQAELRKSQRQQMIAQSLLQQAQDPINNQMAGGMVVPVNPLQGLAKIAQAYVGARAMKKGDDDFQSIAGKYSADQQAAISKVQQALAPTAATPIPLANANGREGEMIERPMADKRAAVQEAMLSQFPNVRNFATAMNSNLQADQMREDNQAFRTQESELARQQRERELLMRLADLKEGREDRAVLMKELAAIKKENGASSNPYFTPVQTAEGVFAFNARTGKVEPVAGPGGKPVVGAQFDPSLQGNLAGAKAGGKEMGEAQAKAQIDLPQAMDKASLASQQIDELLTHPGFTSTVGATLRPGARLVDGTPESDFMKRLDQLKGGAFLQAFEALKGGGQITEAEGKKATEAISRMDKAQSEKEFVAAAREFQGFINKGVQRAKLKAGGKPSAPPAASIESLLEKYK